jgi:hypothetical protein
MSIGEDKCQPSDSQHAGREGKMQEYPYKVLHSYSSGINIHKQFFNTPSINGANIITSKVQIIIEIPCFSEE